MDVESGVSATVSDVTAATSGQVSSTGMDEDMPSRMGPTDDARSVIDDARAGVVAFLADHRADEIVPDTSRVIVLDCNINLASALRALFENGVRAAPISDCTTTRYVGMFSVSDVITALLRVSDTKMATAEMGSDISSQLSRITLRTWKSEYQALENHNAAPPASFGNHLKSNNSRSFCAADAKGSLLDACKLLRDSGVHRLPIIAENNNVLCTLEHWRVLRFVHRHLIGGIEGGDIRTEALFSMTIGQLGIGTFSGLVSVSDKSSLAQVLQVLIRRELSAVPIVGSGDSKLRSVYARTDITALAMAPISKATLDRNIMLTLQSQSIAASATSPNATFQLATCRRDDTLRTVFETFERTRKHRLYAVDDNCTLTGVVSLSDVLAYFLNSV